MELQERISVLVQGVELAQKAGALTLDDAYMAKQAINALNNNLSHKEAFEILIKTVTIGQKKGVYTLRDAYLIYLAADNYESVLPQPRPAPAPAPTTATPQPEPEKRTRTTKKES